jgi:thiol-disulfide isomerase/thioredoxin
VLAGFGRSFSPILGVNAMKSVLAIFEIGFRNRDRASALILLLGGVLSFPWLARSAVGKEPQLEIRDAPELTGIAQWDNSDELTLAGQKGKVVVLHFWAFSCINCKRNLPHYNKWRKDFADDKVQIIGIHTPETADEADPRNVATQIKKAGIKYPVAVDNDGATWRAYENRYWPTVYLIDKQGRVRYRWEGELEYQKAGGDRIMRTKIRELLAEEKQ